MRSRSASPVVALWQLVIRAKMKELGAVFTWEMSGHMFFADEYYGYDDAVYAAGRLLRLLSHRAEPLSALLATIPHYPVTPEVYVDAPDEVKFEVVRQVAEEFRQRYQVVDVDGARVLFPEGWGTPRQQHPASVGAAGGNKTEEALGGDQAGAGGHPSEGSSDWAGLVVGEPAPLAASP